MDAIIRIRVDDDLLSQRVDQANAKLAEEGSAVRYTDPQEYVLERLRDICEDELQVALWGWSSTLGLSLEVELA